MGHEITGTIEAVGMAVNHLKPGDRVGAYWSFGCGRCGCCLSGKEQTCTTNLTNPQSAGITLDGGYAEYIAIRSDYAIPLPDGLDLTDAAPFFCAGLTMYGAFKNAGLRPGQRAAVLGIGGLGHLAIQIANAMGAEVIAVTSSEGKQDLAKKLGAHHTVVAKGADIGAQVMAIGGTDVALSTTLDTASIGGMMQGLRPQGSLVLTGLTTEPLPVIPLALLMMEQRVIGSVIGSRADMQEVLTLAAQNNIRPMTELYPLEEVNAVHARLNEGKVRFRGILTVN